jgi:hypothetical protein
MQFGLPSLSASGLFGALGGAPTLTPKASGGSRSAPGLAANAGLVWIPILAVVAWFRMDNLPGHGSGSTGACLAKVLWLHLLGFAGAAAGLWLLLGPSWEAILGKGRGYHAMWIALPVAVLVTLALLRYAAPSATRVRIKDQYAILKEKHTWVMTLLYIMTFGSFIGYANTLPNLIKDVFGFLPGLDAAGKPLPNANAPNALTYAWLGPLVGSLVRPVGGRLSDRFGGARVTQWSTVVMIGAAIGVAWTIHQARTAPSPETWFAPFLGLILLLFVTTGVGNGSTFRMIPIIFPPAKAGPVLGWTSAIAAYGGFIIPKAFGAQIEAHQPEVALYGFAAFYVLCRRELVVLRAPGRRGAVLTWDIRPSGALGRPPRPGRGRRRGGRGTVLPATTSATSRPADPLLPPDACGRARDRLPVLPRRRRAQPPRGDPEQQICMNCHKFVAAPLADVRAEDAAAAKAGARPGRSSRPRSRSSTGRWASGATASPSPGRSRSPCAGRRSTTSPTSSSSTIGPTWAPASRARPATAPSTPWRASASSATSAWAGA